MEDLDVTVVVVGAENQRDFKQVTLREGTRCSDIKRDLHLEGYGIRKPDNSGQFFADADDVYAVMRKAGADKLEAVPGMQVAAGGEGPSGPSLLRGLATALRSAPLTATRRLSSQNPTIIGPRPAIRIRRLSVPFWLERGWQQLDEKTWKGQYRLPEGTWEGEVVREAARTFVPQVQDPPAAVAAHPHRRCLGFNGKGHRLHFSRTPGSLDAAIMGMENFLAESFVAQRGKE